MAYRNNAPAELAKGDSLDDLLKSAQGATSNIDDNAHYAADNREKKRKTKDLVEEDDENLGENFENSPWVPPSVEKAKEFKKQNIYRGGDARLDSVDLIHAPDLGAGVALYFQFAMTMGICLAVMSLLSLPSLVFVYHGTNISQEDQDPLGLYRYTLGNMGYDSSAPDYEKVSKCTNPNYGRNATCIQVGGGYEFSLAQASGIVTAMEVLQIFVFFCGVMHLYRTALSVTGRNAKSETAVSDYSIIITDIPPDITDKEILEHFSNLYQLSDKDFKNRPALEDALPVQDCSITGDRMFLGTWVADTTLHKGIGEFIKGFKTKQHVMERMYRNRAKMKMYAENSPHADGHNITLYTHAEKEMLVTAMMIDKLTEQNIKRTGLKILLNHDVEAGQGHAEADEITRLHLVSNPKSIYYNIDAPATAAFVTFEYAESLARCVRDYEPYNSFPMSLFYPEMFTIRGHKVKVAKAPEPDQIVWENLEVSYAQKFYLRTRTFLITCALIVVCFIIILQASIYKSLLAGSLPSKLLCTEIPQVYSNASDAANYIPTRPSGGEQLALDSACQTYVSGTFYSVYTKTGDDYTKPVVLYELDACTNSSAEGAHYRHGGLCPIHNEPPYCPCVSTSSTEKCSLHYNYQTVGETYPAKSIGACYCYHKLSSLLSGGVTHALSAINNLDSYDCNAFFKQYSLSQGLTYVAVATTTIINVFLRSFLKNLATHEAHVSTDTLQGSIMLKIFFSNYINMAIIILIAYGGSNNLPPVLKALHIFAGPYHDFTSSWYGVIGFYLMTTFIIQSFSPLVANLFLYYIGKPLLRFYHHERVR